MRGLGHSLSSRQGVAKSFREVAEASHLFKTHVGFTIPRYINYLRIEHAKELLSTTNDSITAIGTKVGFDDPNYFCRFLCAFPVLPAVNTEVRNIGNKSQ